MEKLVGKIIIAREICESKDVLFGPFGPQRTCQMKADAWNKILDKAKSLGLIAASKDYRYLRDVYWQNMKRYALFRRENEQMHGKKFKKTPMDDLIYEIVDNTSSLHQPPSQNDQNSILNSPDADTLHHSIMIKTDHDYDFMDEDDHEVQVTVEKINYREEDPSQLKDRQAQLEMLSQSNDATNAISRYNKQKMQEKNFKKRKAKLEIDFLELQNYKTQLEVLQLENKLGIKPSRFTKDIAERNRSKKDTDENLDCESDESDFNVSVE